MSIVSAKCFAASITASSACRFLQELLHKVKWAKKAACKDILLQYVTRFAKTSHSAKIKIFLVKLKFIIYGP